jgi:predicted HTH domain antitoxin
MKNMKKEYKNDKLKVKTLRLKDTSINLIYNIAKEKNLTESEYIRSLIEKDISKYRLKKAIEEYKKKKVNISEGAEMAGLSYREFLEKLEENRVPLNMDGLPISYGLKSIKRSLKD